MTDSEDSVLAIMGGTPVRKETLPYGTQSIDQNDIEAVSEVLGSRWLTTGPLVEKFEDAIARSCETSHAVAVCNGTAALHAAVYAAEIGPGDEVIVPAMTFAASANAVLYEGGIPVFCDVDPGSLLADPDSVAALITKRTKAVIAVDYAGHPCRYDDLRSITDQHGLTLIADACHAIGGSFKNRAVGSLADLSTFSFHPVKHLTTGEGGIITTDDEGFAQRMRAFRNHGITSDHRQRAQTGAWFYEMVDLGYNYRLSDIHCALGLSQLSKLPGWVKRRQVIAAQYDAHFDSLEEITPLTVSEEVSHAYHLYVVRVHTEHLTASRNELFDALRQEGIGVNLHYIPVHLHPYYQKNVGTFRGMCPTAERAYGEIITLPMFPAMSDSDVSDVTSAVNKVINAFRA